MYLVGKRHMVCTISTSDVKTAMTRRARLKAAGVGGGGVRSTFISELGNRCAWAGIALFHTSETT